MTDRTMNTKPYKASRRLESCLHYVNGPGDGMSYHSHTLWPHLSMTTKEEAERAAEIANIAYKAGYEKAQHDIKTAIGL